MLPQYLLVPYGNLNAVPMSPNTKDKVKYSRNFQLALRVLAFVGALGILFCVIAIKGTSGSLGWIIRVAPAVALLHTVYAIYHLCRSPTGRTAGSSASYMVFAAMIDAGLLPFLTFSAFMAYNEHTTGAYGWDTLFGVPLTTWYIVYCTFILCVVEGGLLLVSLLLGIYLAILFRKISKLPPDMNPLEPNLTARPHKRNKSELTLSDKQMSRTSLASDKRMSSTGDLLITPGRRVPFMHTRTDSANSSPRNSRIDAPRPESMYQSSNHSFRRDSHVAIDKSLPNPPSRPQSAMAPSISSRNVGAGLDHRPARSSQLSQEGNGWPLPNPNSEGSPLDTYHQRVTTPRYSQMRSINDENIPPISPVSSAPSTPDPDREAEYMEIKNWYESSHVKNKKSQDYIPITQKEFPQSRQHSQTRAQQAIKRRQAVYDFDRDLFSPNPKVDKMTTAVKEPKNPLGMNPPSPESSEYQIQNRRHSIPERYFESQNKEPKRHTLQDAPVNIPTPAQRPRIGGSRPLSFVGSGTKGRYYGNLTSPVGSVNGNLEKEKETPISRAELETKSDTASNYSRQQSTRTRTMDSHIDIYSDDQFDNEDREKGHIDILAPDTSQRKVTQQPLPRPFTYPSRHQSPEPTADIETDRKGRVVSATSADPHDLSSTYSYAGLGAEFGRGMGRRREVSGKIAEEGRAIGTSDDGIGYQQAYTNMPTPARNEPSRNSIYSRPGTGQGTADGPAERETDTGMTLSPEARAMARMWDYANATAQLERERELEKEAEKEKEKNAVQNTTPKKNRIAGGLGAAGWARFKGL